MSADLVAFVRGCREPTSIYELAGELANLGKHGAEWPRATAEQWRRDLLALVAKGELTIDGNDLVWVPRSETPKQMTLF